MRARAATAEVRAMLDRFAGVALLGLRQVGKSTLASDLISEMGGGAELLDLRSPAAEPCLADPAGYLAARAGTLVVLDEIQTRPDIIGVLRDQVERRRRAGLETGQFLLLGSDSAKLQQLLGEQLGGYLGFVELGPIQPFELQPDPPPENDWLDVAEVTAVPAADDLASERALWVRGGLPRSLDAADETVSYQWRRAFMETETARGMTLDGSAVPPAVIGQAMQLLALGHGHYVPLHGLAVAIGCTEQAAERFVHHYVGQRLLRLLPQWHRQTAPRFASRKKVYVRDSGLLHAIIGLPDVAAIDADDVAGRSWEGHVIEAAIAAAGPNKQYGYFRSEDDRSEIDLVLAAGGRTLALEVKKSSSPSLSKAFHAGVAELKPERVIVAYSGQERYRRDLVEFMGLRDALREIANF